MKLWHNNLDGNRKIAQKRRKTPVTIIVGIICKDRIILASDSQTSWSNSKRTDTDKISRIDFGGAGSVLIAQSGNAELSSRAVEEFEKVAKTASFDNARRPVDVLEDCLRTLKQNLINQNLWEKNREIANDYFQDISNNFGLMAAYFYGDPPVPYIYIVNFWPGIAARQRGYATLGCGSTVAEFILSRSKISEMKWGMAMMTAIYTIEEVKKVDAFCGGQTKIATVGPSGKSTSTNKQRNLDLIKYVVDSMSKHEDKTRAAWIAMMDKIAKDAFKNYKKQYPDGKSDSEE
jgi:20S proteasome alpha/beta subunit